MVVFKEELQEGILWRVDAKFGNSTLFTDVETDRTLSDGPGFPPNTSTPEELTEGSSQGSFSTGVSSSIKFSSTCSFSLSKYASL